MNQIFFKIEGSDTIYPWPGDTEDPPTYLSGSDLRLRQPKPIRVFEYTFNSERDQYVIKEHPHDAHD